MVPSDKAEETRRKTQVQILLMGDEYLRRYASRIFLNLEQTCNQETNEGYFRRPFAFCTPPVTALDCGHAMGLILEACVATTRTSHRRTSVLWEVGTKTKVPRAYTQHSDQGVCNQNTWQPTCTRAPFSKDQCNPWTWHPVIIVTRFLFLI